MWINDSSKDPVGRKPEDIMRRVADNKMAGERLRRGSWVAATWKTKQPCWVSIFSANFIFSSNISICSMDSYINKLTNEPCQILRSVAAAFLQIYLSIYYMFN